MGCFIIFLFLLDPSFKVFHLKEISLELCGKRNKGSNSSGWLLQQRAGVSWWVPGEGAESWVEVPFATVMQHLRQNNFAMKRGLLRTLLGALSVSTAGCRPWKRLKSLGGIISWWVAMTGTCIQGRGRPGKSSGIWLIFVTLGSCGKSEAPQFLIAMQGSSLHALRTSLCAPLLYNLTGPQASKNDVTMG